MKYLLLTLYIDKSTKEKGLLDFFTTFTIPNLLLTKKILLWQHHLKTLQKSKFTR